MATTQNTYTGDNSTVSYSFTFPYLEETDIKVSLDGVVTTAYTLSNATTVTFNTAPGSGVAIRIYRDTNNDALAATFFAGSAIRAQDLNDDFLQNAYVTQEVKNRYFDRSTGGTITGDVAITGDFDVTGDTTLTGAVDVTGNVSIDGTLDMNANRILDVGTPSATTDATNKAYVDAYILTVYQGPQASDPTTRSGGSALQEGDLYFNTVEDVLKAYTGSEWVVSASAGQIVRWRKTAAGGETSLSGNDDDDNTLSYVVGNEQVFLNGVLQQRGVDYTASTGTSITGLTALTADDVVELHAVQGYTSGIVSDGSITSAKIANDTIVNADVNSSAAIAYSKLNLTGSVDNDDVATSAGIVATKLSFTQSGDDAVARTVDSKLKDVVSVKDFGATGDGTTDDTDAIQAAIDYVESRGTLVANKSGIGGVVFIPTGTYIVSDTLKIESSGVTIAGEGWTATTIRAVDDQKDVFLFAGPDPFNTGNANAIAARPTGQGIRDLEIYLQGSDQTDSKNTTFIKVKRGLFEASNLYLQGYHVGIYLGGVAEGTRLDSIYMSSSGGTAVVTQKTDSCHIHVALEPVDSADGLAQAGGDGNFYDRAVGVYLSNIQTKDPSGNIGVYDALKVDAVDGLYVNNCHFGFASNAQVRIHTPKNIGALNCLFSNVFLDSNNSIGGPASSYGFLVENSGGYNAQVNNTVITGMRANGSKLGGIFLNHPNLNGFTCVGFSISQAFTPTSLKGAITVNNGDSILIDNGNIDGMEGGFYILVNGGNYVTLSNITGYSNAGLNASEGVRLQGSPTHLFLSNVRVTDYSTVGFKVSLPNGTIFDLTDCYSDDSVSIPSATTTVIPIEKDYVYVTGTTNIMGIDSTALGNSTWEGREVTLVFDDVLTVLASGTTGVRSDFITSNGASLTLAHVNGAWREKSRTA
jgi:hypothetical protein